MGIDPGSRYLGFGIISVSAQNEIKHLDHGVISTDGIFDFPQRLNVISQELHFLLNEYKPHDVVVENIFLGKNPQSIFRLSHVRGVCLQKGAEFKANIFEYAPRTIKKIVTGSGAASKEHVRLVTLSELQIETRAMLDATDALSLALGHHYAQRTKNKLNAELDKIEKMKTLNTENI